MRDVSTTAGRRRRVVRHANDDDDARDGIGVGIGVGDEGCFQKSSRETAAATTTAAFRSTQTGDDDARARRGW